MKRATLITLALLLATTAMAQTAGRAPDDFRTGQPMGDQRPMPMPFLRYEDIVWKTYIWYAVESAELFNQFFYFPNDEFRTAGKKSLAYIIWDAVVAGEIPIYEDEDLKVPIDNEAFVYRYTKADTIMLEVGYDDDNDTELYETIIRPKRFDGSEVLQYALYDAWFIGRQDTRQEFRHLALAPVKQTFRELPNGEEIYLGMIPIFWIPMQNMAVRSLLARYPAYTEHDNVAGLPSWDWVFLNRYFQAYATRESNAQGRAIRDYLTGEDALLEAEAIEDRVFELENGMWEY